MAAPARILAVCGSLRAASSNRTALEAAALSAPTGVEVVFYEGLADLPAFNPDDDREDAAPHPAVAALRGAVDGADALLISSPEYAHGVPGSLKNALDWLVSHAAFGGKRIGLINTAPHAHHAQEQLRETLTMMSAEVVEGACITLPLTGRPAGAATVAADPELGPILKAGLEALAP